MSKSSLKSWPVSSKLIAAAVLLAIVFSGIWMFVGSGDEGRPSPLAKRRAVAADQANKTQVVASLPWELDAPTAPSDILIVTELDGAQALDVSKINNAHFAIDFKNEFCNWFMFRIEGAKGHTVRIDLRSVPLNKWATLNPVYSTVASIDTLDAFATTPTGQSVDDYETQARNGPKLPDTNGQKWHFIENVWTENKSDLCFELKMPEDRVWIAMRYPYTPGYNEAYMASLSGRPNVEVIEIGKSKSGRPLHVVKVSGGEDAERENPCIVMYAREHASEQDPSWLVQGVIEAAAGDTPGNKTSVATIDPSRTTYLLIPLLDPDGASAGEFDRITDTFVEGRQNPTSIAYSKFFMEWFRAGKPIDVVLNLHCVESKESPHLACAQYEPDDMRGATCRIFNEEYACDVAKNAGYRVTDKPGYRGMTSWRLGGWLNAQYGALHMPYEANAQDRSRHLSIDDLQNLGLQLMIAAQEFIDSRDGGSALAVIHERAEKRRADWARLGPKLATFNIRDDGIAQEDRLEYFLGEELMSSEERQKWNAQQRLLDPTQR